MRTTLSLENDVAALIERLRKRKGLSAKSLINEALRRGLVQMANPESRAVPYRTPGVSLGKCLHSSLDDVAEVLALAEGEDYR